MEGDNKIFNVLSYFGILWLIGLIAKPNEPDVRFHVNQGIILSIALFAAGLLNIIPILGQILFGLVGLAVFIFAIMGIVSAVKGEQKELPLIGKFKILK